MDANIMIHKYFILISMTSKVIEGHKRSLLCLIITCTYVLKDTFLSLFYLEPYRVELLGGSKI